jgi:hypothetical protein
MTAGCGSPADDAPPVGGVAGFDPPPVRPGYTRFIAPVITGIAPGTDVTYCQYIQAPLDRAMDILDVDGFQSQSSHHAVAYATTKQEPVGTSRPCEGDDSMGASLGGIGGEGGGGFKLPEGVAFRVPAGSSILLNAHFLNTSTQPLDGRTVLDIKFVEIDAHRKIASLFTNVNATFALPPRSPAQAVADCNFPRDMEFILFSNHMHHYGTSARTEIRRASGAVDLVHEDPVWEPEMEYRAVLSGWPINDPLRVMKGDVMHTECNWRNTSDDVLNFPTEMCIAFGYFVTDAANASSPVCAGAYWRD